VADKSRKIAYITYDLNNNPKQIYFMNGSVTKYVYSATGQKLRAVHYTAKPNITRTWGVKPAELTAAQIQYTDSTDYLLGGSLTMKNGRIDKFLFDGGYAQASVASSTTDNFAFYYYNQDHLGNIREVVNASGSVQQVTNYYPFGAPYADAAGSSNPDFQPYKYNGKELDKMHGLNSYDYGARQHDPILCRWDRIDPLCEDYYPYSPYNYCLDNPVKNTDPDGKAVETGWDIFNVGLDIASLSSNVKNGNVGAAIVDGICLVADVAATAVPFIPGGAGTAVKAARTAEKAVNVTKSVGTAKMTRLRKSAEIGQEAHRQIEREIIKNNPGAKAEQTIRLGKNQKVRKDVVLADGKTVIIIKPNTKSGQKAAQKRFDLMKKNGYKPQKVFYNPNDPKYLPGSPTYIGPQKK
jgi:RHS repeat-associated protein